MAKEKKVIAVLPAYNAAKTLAKTIKDIPPNTVHKIILVDDGSSDNTVCLAKRYGLEVIAHPQNRGYGANQKTCYTFALSQKADVIVMIHPDYQYDSSLTAELIRPIVLGKFDVMLGSRIRTRKEALSGGMPPYKYVGNRILTSLENVVLGQNLSEYHTGFRAFSSNILRKVPFHKYSDSFVFDQQIIFGLLGHQARIGEIPVSVRYFPEASSIDFTHSLVYGFSILRDLGLHLSTQGKYFTK